MTRSSLNPPECCRLEWGCVWSQQALAHPHTGRDVTAESCCLSARSAEQGRCCYIISLLNKTSKIFNLAFCDHMARVQAAWFYMGAQMDIVSPSPSCLVVLFSDVPMELFFFFFFWKRTQTLANKHLQVFTEGLSELGAWFPLLFI